MGEVIDLGVGEFATYEEGGYAQFALRPNDNRKFWHIDPYKLYRLHDQTVEVYIAVTDVPFTEAPKHPDVRGGVYSNGDGSFQSKFVEMPTTIPAKITYIEDGLFTVSPPTFKKGERID